MKRIFKTGLVSPAILFLTLGSAAYAQKEQEKEAKPEKSQQQAKPAQQRPERAQQAPRQQSKPAEQKPERAQHEQKQQAKPVQQSPERAQHEQKQQAKPVQQAPQRAQHEQKQQAAPVEQQARQARSAPPQRSKQVARGWQQQRGWLQQGGGWQGNSSWQQGRATQWQAQHRTWGERGGYGGYYIPEATFALSFGDQHWFRITSQPTIVGGYPRFQHDGFSFLMLDPWPEDWGQDWYATDDVYVGYDDGYYLYNRRAPGEGIAISIVL